MVEAMKRAYADRAVFMGDPDAIKMPVAGLTSKKYAASLRAQIGERATPSAEIRAGKPADFEGRNTTHFSVIDSAGNAVSNTYTLNFSYGLGLVAEGTGVLLNNELDDFTSKPGTANAYGLVGYDANLPGPGKRPLSSMTPTIVLKDGKPFLITGLAGRQPHHYCRAADHRECNRLSYADRPSRQCSPPAPPVAAGRGLRRAWICAGGIGGPGKTRPQHRADAVLQFDEFHRSHARRLSRRGRPALRAGHSRRGIEAIGTDAVRAERKLERAKGFEPSTPTLARSCSTPELHPHPLDIWPNRDIGRQGRSYSQKACPIATTAFRRMAEFSDQLRGPARRLRARGFAFGSSRTHRGFRLQKPRLPASTLGRQASNEAYWQSSYTEPLP